MEPALRQLRPSSAEPATPGSRLRSRPAGLDRTAWPYALLALAAVAATAMRLRFAGVPLTADEGGYAVIASLWADGAALYDTAWVDRPQGLVVLYRLAAEAGPTGVRVLTLVATVVTTAAVGWAAQTLAGRRAAVLAVALYVLVSPAPRLEGWAANGELLAGSLTTTGIACLLSWWKGGHGSGRLLAAGMLLVSSAPLVKQSAVEGLLVAVVLVAPHAHARWRALGWAVLPWAVALAHAVTVGIDRWWFAVAGYRLYADRPTDGVLGRLGLFWDAVPPLVLDAAPLLAVGVISVGRLSRRHRIYGAWLLGGLVGVVGGGLFHPHYWLQLLPLGAVAAAVVWSRAPRRVLPAVVAGVVVLAAGWVPFLLTRSPDELVVDATGEPRLATAEELGHELASLSGPDDTVLVVWAAASVYVYAERDPATPYIWFRPLRFIDGASGAILDRMGGTDPPAAVAVAQPPALLDPGGRLWQLLRERYQRVSTIDGVPVYALRG